MLYSPKSFSGWDKNFNCERENADYIIQGQSVFVLSSTTYVMGHIPDDSPHLLAWRQLGVEQSNYLAKRNKA